MLLENLFDNEYKVYIFLDKNNGYNHVIASCKVFGRIDIFSFSPQKMFPKD